MGKYSLTVPRTLWVQIAFDEGMSAGSPKTCCTCSPLTRARTRRSWCLGECRSACGQRTSFTDQAWLQMVPFCLGLSLASTAASTSSLIIGRCILGCQGPLLISKIYIGPNIRTKRFCKNLLEFWCDSRPFRMQSHVAGVAVRRCC